MKLILANNQSDKFRSFYNELQAKGSEPFEYTGYSSLVFKFDPSGGQPVEVINIENGRKLKDYDGVYINGYLNTYELAASAAICCNYLKIDYVNKELSDPPSLSKLTMYAKLAANGVSVPRTMAGTKKALINALETLGKDISYPQILKRADADRGVDNYKVTSHDEVKRILKDQSDRSLWLLQDYIDNRGFYLVSFYNSQPVFSIYRTLETRPDNNELKAHMYKPVGGKNASLINISDLPDPLLKICKAAIMAMNRQIASVDCLYDEFTHQAYILEVNYNPQLVTIETFKEERIQAFIDNLPHLGK